jgi:hypothetical protein
MDWKPISEERLKQKLSEEVTLLPALLRKKYESCKIGPYPLPCLRSGIAGVERVFVVARLGAYCILYDDVEDEFAVAVMPEKAPLTEWRLFGELEYALSALG